MKKTKKVKLSVAISAIAVVMAIGLFSVVSASGLSLKEMIAQVVGNNITNEIKSSGMLDEIKAENETLVDNEEGLTFGAIPGDSIPGNYFSIGGVRYYSVKGNMKSGTSTACSLPAPKNATSTLINASVTFKTSSTSAMTIGFAKAASFAASTTPTGTDYALAANASVTLNASTTAPAGVIGTVNTFRPGSDGSDNYLNVFFWNSTSGAYTRTAPTGSCSGLWKLDQ